MSLPRCLLEMVPISRSEDIATTILRAAMAGLWGLIIQLIPVVVGEFLTYPNISERHNPDDTPELFSLAVWVTRMVDIPCRVLVRTPINGVPLIQAKDIDVAAAKRRSLSSWVIFSPMYRISLVPCRIACSANSPCPAMRDGLTRTRIFTRGRLLVCAEVLPVPVVAR